VASAKDWLRLVRAPLGLTAAFDVVACAALARGPGLGDGAPALAAPDALLLAATSVLVYFAGMAGNDLADRGRDRTLHPDRPLPAGRIAPGAALALVVVLAAGAAALGGGPAGSRVAVLAALGAAALYDGGAKRRAVPGALAMGLVRASNAATGVVPLVAAGLASPLALLAPLLVGAYSAGVTYLSTAEDRPAREARTRLVGRAATVVAFGGGGALALVGAGGVAFTPLFAFPVVLSAVFDRVPRKGPVKRQVLEMLLGLYWLDAVLVGGAAPGSSWVLALGAIAAAWAAIVLSQLAIRALR